MLTALRPARNLITRKAFTHTTTRTPTTTFARNMSNANSDQLAQGGEAAGIQLDPTRRALVQSVLDLFSGKVSNENLAKNWTDNAVFEDPLSVANGREQFAAQWWGLAKVFPKSETVAIKVVKDEPALIEYEQRQKYTLPLVHTIKEMASLVHIELDPATGKITKLEDRWDNKSLSNVSGITKKLRDFNGSYFTPALVSVPK